MSKRIPVVGDAVDFYRNHLQADPFRAVVSKVYPAAPLRSNAYGDRSLWRKLVETLKPPVVEYSDHRFIDVDVTVEGVVYPVVHIEISDEPMLVVNHCRWS
jgi:hypothetical protein